MVTISFSKKDFVWIGLIVVLLCAGFGIAAWDNTKAMFHDSNDVRVTIDNLEYSLQEALDSGFIGGGMKFGEWTDKISGTTYQADSDGIVVVRTGNIDNDVNGWQRIYSDSESSPLTICASALAEYSTDRATLICPIKKGDYWKVTGDSPSSVRWMPLV